jgi:alkylation response protein AidB-like acyl-CoA dehydrogenase
MQPVASGVLPVDAFADEVTAFLDRCAVRTAAREFAWGQGSDDRSVFVETDPDTEAAELAAARAFRAARYDAGLGWITGPAAYGGRELSRAHEMVFHAVADRYTTPPMRFFGIGLGMVAPTVLAHGQQHIKDRYLPAMYRGDLVACQLFSEPGAGSDLASVSTRAVRTDDGWLVDGQKVWTSGAHYSDIALLLARTDRDLPKHKGLTMFLVDMRAAGVLVRPLRQMTGGASFNEVFLDSVFVAEDHRLGDVNDGWRVALTTLSNERASIGAGGEVSARLEFVDFEALAGLVKALGRDTDTALRQGLARIHSARETARWTAQRAMEQLLASGTPGPELSAAKLTRTNTLQLVVDFVATALGERMVADTGEWGTFSWTSFVLGVPGLRIAGGTDEIQRKIISEQVLGLPR